MKPEPMVDVLVLGGGRAGAMAAALSRRAGLSVRVLEKTQFPRFSIGESMLPQSLVLLEQAGMLEAVEQAGFQYKDGAQICRGDRRVDFEFSMKTCAGYPHAYQVTRADFDHILIKEAQKQGAEVRYRQEIVAAAFDVSGAQPWSPAAPSTGARSGTARASCSTPAASAASCRACWTSIVRPTSRCALRCSCTSRITSSTRISTATRSASRCIPSTRTSGTG